MYFVILFGNNFIALFADFVSCYVSENVYIMYQRKTLELEELLDLINGYRGSRSEARTQCTGGELLCQTHQNGRGSPPILLATHS
jgi:hypothetical protein